MEPVSLPDTINLFGTLDTTLPPERVARFFAYRGWNARKCSWSEYEVTCPVAELVVRCPDGKSNCVLVRGAVADVVANLPQLIEPIARAGIPYSFECYDETFNLIHHTRG